MKHLLLTTLIGLAALTGAAQAADPIENTVLKAEDRSFFVAADPIQFAVAAGDLQVGPQGTFGKFPANFQTPTHVHSHAYQAIVISGEMTNPFEGEENPPSMTAGSFWSVAAGAKHATACVSDTPCEFFMYASEGFDFEVVE